MLEAENSTKNAPEAVRVTVLNSACDYMLPGEIRTIVCRVIRKAPDAYNWSDYPNVFDEVQRHLLACSDSKVYKIIEAIYESLDKRQPHDAAKFEDEINECFIEEDINLSMVNGIMTNQQGTSERTEMKPRSDASRVAESVNIAELNDGVTFGSSHESHVASTVDIGIIIALKEEFRVFHNEIKDIRTSTSNENGDTYYTFNWPSGTSVPYSCAALFINDMGHTAAILATQRMIHEVQPATIINIGIAGSLSQDTKLGDVIVAEIVDCFMEGSKAISGPSEDTFTLRSGGTQFRTSNAILKAARNFEFVHAAEYEAWNKMCLKYRSEVITSNNLIKLTESGVIGEKLMSLEGHLASGPTVGASSAFKKWLKEGRDRRYLGLEMEAGGILATIHEESKQRRSLIVRGVSDPSDEQKEELDKTAKGALRSSAMYNAIQFVWMLLAVGIIPRATLQRPQEVALAVKPAARPASAQVQKSRQAPIGVEKPVNVVSTDTDGVLVKPSEAEKSWTAIDSKIEEIKAAIESTGVPKTDYARFLFLDQQDQGQVYNKCEGICFDEIIENNLVTRDSDADQLYHLNREKRRNKRLRELISDTQAMLDKHIEEFGNDPDFGQEEDELFDYNFNDPDFWLKYVGYRVTA